MNPTKQNWWTDAAVAELRRIRSVGDYNQPAATGRLSALLSDAGCVEPEIAILADAQTSPGNRVLAVSRLLGGPYEDAVAQLQLIANEMDYDMTVTRLIDDGLRYVQTGEGVVEDGYGHGMHWSNTFSSSSVNERFWSAFSLLTGITPPSELDTRWGHYSCQC